MEDSRPQEVPHSYTFLQALATVCSVLLIQLHYQTTRRELNRAAAFIADVTWSVLVTAIAVSMIHIYFSNKHAVAPHTTAPSILALSGLLMLLLTYALANLDKAIIPSVLSVGVVVYAAYADRRCKRRR